MIQGSTGMKSLRVPLTVMVQQLSDTQREGNMLDAIISKAFLLSMIPIEEDETTPQLISNS